MHDAYAKYACCVPAASLGQSSRNAPRFHAQIWSAIHELDGYRVEHEAPQTNALTHSCRNEFRAMT